MEEVTAEAEYSDARKRRRKTPQDIQAIRLEDLRTHFRLPLTEAAEALGISANSLKRVCRRWQIHKWPFRELQGIERMQQQISKSLAACSPADLTMRAQLGQHLQQLESRKRGLLQEEGAQHTHVDNVAQEPEDCNGPASTAEWLTQPKADGMGGYSSHLLPRIPSHHPGNMLRSHPLVKYVDEIQSTTLMLGRRVEELEKLLHNMIATTISRPFMAAGDFAAATQQTPLPPGAAGDSDASPQDQHMA